MPALDGSRTTATSSRLQFAAPWAKRAASGEAPPSLLLVRTAGCNGAVVSGRFSPRCEADAADHDCFGGGCQSRNPEGK